MTTPSTTRAKVIELIDDLPNDFLPEVVQFVEYLHFKTKQGMVAAPSETALLAIINRRLPLPDQNRLDELRAKNETGQITESERTELLAYVERIEQEDAERAEALVELARRRGLPLTTLIRELKIESNVV